MLKQLVNRNPNEKFSEKQLKLMLKICERKLQDIDDVLDESKVLNIQINN